MEIGRNLEKYGERIAIVFRWDGEKQYRRYWFATHQAAMRKFNQLRKSGASYFDINKDVTI